MSPRKEQRTEGCGPGEAAIRLSQAKKFLEVATLVESEAALLPSSASLTAALAVLAGIAASDAACCSALRRRSRSAYHKDAGTLLRLITHGGPAAAKQFERLIALKDSAHYGVIHPNQDALTGAMRDAAGLVTFAEAVLRRQ